MYKIIFFLLTLTLKANSINYTAYDFIDNNSTPAPVNVVKAANNLLIALETESMHALKAHYTIRKKVNIECFECLVLTTCGAIICSRADETYNEFCHDSRYKLEEARIKIYKLAQQKVNQAIEQLAQEINNNVCKPTHKIYKLTQKLTGPFIPVEQIEEYPEGIAVFRCIRDTTNLKHAVKSFVIQHGGWKRSAPILQIPITNVATSKFYLTSNQRTKYRNRQEKEEKISKSLSRIALL